MKKVLEKLPAPASVRNNPFSAYCCLTSYHNLFCFSTEQLLQCIFYDSTFAAVAFFLSIRHVLLCFSTKVLFKHQYKFLPFLKVYCIFSLQKPGQNAIIQSINRIYKLILYVCICSEDASSFVSEQNTIKSLNLFLFLFLLQYTIQVKEGASKHLTYLQQNKIALHLFPNFYF